jgi:hypothetical protein
MQIKEHEKNFTDTRHQLEETPLKIWYIASVLVLRYTSDITKPKGS